jgi:hypothetical protein
MVPAEPGAQLAALTKVVATMAIKARKKWERILSVVTETWILENTCVRAYIYTSTHRFHALVRTSVRMFERLGHF